MVEKIKKPEPLQTEVESGDFMSPEKVASRRPEHMKSLLKAKEMLLNGEAVVEVRKTENGRYKSLSIFRIDPNTKEKKERLVYFDNMREEIGPFEQQLWKMGIEPIHITEPGTETMGLKQKFTDFAQDIKQSKFSREETVKKWGTEHEEMLAALFDLLKKDAVRLRVKHNKNKNTWNAEIYFIGTNGVWYYTDFPNEIKILVETISDNGYEPEYIEE